MATPQEKRFARLALETGALSRKQLGACASFQERKREKGSSIPLWDCAVLQDLMAETDAERLVEQAGDLPSERLGDFTLVRKLGQGGMGAVYRAEGPSGRDVALKVLAPRLASQRTFLTRFLREAQASCRLAHSNLVRGIQVGEHQGRYFFAMEFVDGTSVEEMLEQNGSVPVERATEIVLQVSDALVYAHQKGLVHRDIKPANVMVTAEGVAKLADLGLARQLEEDRTALTRTGTSMGTPLYMAPEQAMDAKRADARSDIYSLGATWYHMLAGRPPFEAPNPVEIMQKHLREPLKSLHTVAGGIPRGVSATVDRMMAKDPDRRIQTAGELRDTIREKCTGSRDVVEELGLKRKRKPQSLWDVKLAVGDHVEKRRFALPEIRTLIRKGQFTGKTLVKRAGAHDAYQPAQSFRELQRELPYNFTAAARAAMETRSSQKREELHDLVTHFDRAERSHSRRKKLHRLIPYLVEILLLAAAAGAVWVFRDRLIGLVQRLLSGGGPF